MSGQRATQLDVDEARRLDHFAASLDVMFPANVGILHVGSSLASPDYRDVDVRVVLRDDDFRTLAAQVNLLDLNMLLSGWGRQVTGLRIDCQVQSQADANNAEGPRRSLAGWVRSRPVLDAALPDHPGEPCPNLADCPKCEQGHPPRQRLTIDEHIERLEVLRAVYRTQAVRHRTKRGRQRLFQRAHGVDRAIRTIKNGEHR